jgi:hypothetical protein
MKAYNELRSHDGKIMDTQNRAAGYSRSRRDVFSGRVKRIV